MTAFSILAAYIFSFFVGQSDGLHLAYSRDGFNWTPIADNRPLLKPEIGEDKLMRDPSICQGPDGTFHMVWTSSWTDRIIGYASSTDLIHWSEQKAIPVMMHESEAHNCWAPEVTWDPASKLFYIPPEGMIPQDGDATFDHIHPNDYGMHALAHCIAKTIKTIVSVTHKTES